jgi:hypothetical protein
MSGIKKAKRVWGSYKKNSSQDKKKSYNGTVFEIPSKRMNFRRRITPIVKEAKTGIKEKFEEFKKHPGQSILGSVSGYVGGGGRKGIAKAGEELEELGKKTNNKTSQKVGELMKEHPKSAILVAGVGGGLALRGVRNKLYRTTSKAIEKVDPNAYAYAKYGAQPIPGENEEENEDE